MGKGTVKMGRRGLPTDRPLRPLPERGDEREAWVPLKGSGYDVPFTKPGTPPGSGKATTSKANGGDCGKVSTKRGPRG